MKNNIVVVFSSHLSEEENQKFINHVHETIGAKHKVVCYPNYNQFSLAQIYNEALKTHKEDNCVFVFCHNDMIYRTKNWGKILLNQFNHSDYSIIGVAGTTFIPDTGMWWGDRSKIYGIVEHTDGLSTWVSEYSNQFNGVKPTLMIDGLFMGVDPDGIVKGFNENYGRFHFYDITFCVDNYLEDVNIGVTTSIRVLHKSVGQTNQSWEDNRVKFASEYQLPMRYISEGKLRVLICCQYFKNYTGSEVSNYELSKELVKQGCDVTLISTMVGDPLQRKALINGVRVYSIANLPNYALDQEGKFHFVKNEQEFDVIHINHKPIGDLILGLYPNTPAVMHVRSEVIPIYEEPIINPQIKRYISIRDSITEYIKTFGITDDKIALIDNPFDYTRFNRDYVPIKNPKEVVLFIGTLDHLRIKIILDLIEMTKENNQELWIIGDDNGKNLHLIHGDHVKYLGVKSNVEEYLKKCDYTAGIFKGRTTIEGFLCGKPGWIYIVDNQGNIQSKVLTQPPLDVEKYRSDYSAKKVFNLYEEVIEETWLSNVNNMKTLNEYFSKIYCINLDRRTDKWKECLMEFKKINIDVERISAIDGAPIFRPGIHKNAGAYGLLLTNIKIIENAIKNKYKNILILEDDIMFIDNFNELFNDKIKSLPDDWDLLYLGGNNMFHQGNFNLITGDKNFSVTKQNYKTLNHELCKTTWTQTTHAVAINSKFYDTIMSAINKNSTKPIDNVYCILQQEGCNAYTFLPSLALQRPSLSDIEGWYIDYSKAFDNSF